MSTNHDFHLNARAATILASMLDNALDRPPSFAALLRRKLSRSSISFDSDVPSNVVKLNSQVIYIVDGELAGPHLIVPNEGEDFPDYVLSIHDIRGLALLGLSEGQSIHIQEDDAEPTMLSVVKVGPSFRTIDDARFDTSSRVVAFCRKPANTPPIYEPDDPGPHAA